MKALTISQPFASLILSGEKWVENRRWWTDYRGPLAIHAGKGTQYLDREELATYPTGCVIAVADLVACVNIATPLNTEMKAAGITAVQLVSHKHAEGPWCWVLQNVRAVDPVVPYRGAQGLWEWDEVVPEAETARV